MTRIGKILAIGAIAIAPLAIAGIPAAPANAQVYVGPAYPYACAYANPYYCGYDDYDYGWPGYVGFGFGGGYYGGGYGGYYGGGHGGGFHGGGFHGGGFHGGGGHGGGGFHR